MVEATSNNAFGASTTLIRSELADEWDAWDNWLLPEVREILRELPVEFSAIESLRAYREIRQHHMFQSQSYIIEEFKLFMRVNVQRVLDEMEKENASGSIRNSEAGGRQRHIRRDQPRARIRRGAGARYSEPKHYFAL